MTVPIIPIRGFSFAPWSQVTFEVGRKKSKLAIDAAINKDRQIFLLAQKNDDNEDPSDINDFYNVGCYAHIDQTFIVSDRDILRVRVMVMQKGRVDEFLSAEPYFSAVPLSMELIDNYRDEKEKEASFDKLKSCLISYLINNTNLKPEYVENFESIDNLALLTDVCENNFIMTKEQRQAVLECSELKKKTETLIEIAEKAFEENEIRQEIQKKVKQRIDKSQREYYLREEMKTIQDELNGGENKESKFRKQLAELNISEQHKEHISREIDRLESYAYESADSASLVNYLETIFDLPWGKVDESKIDLEVAEKILDKDHYGLKIVKERILEYLAVNSLKEEAFAKLDDEYNKLIAKKGVLSKQEKSDYDKKKFTLLRSPILCFVGPPGVGKTSIAKSIAEASGRRFERMSLGGVHDEAEIRGHRRTYVGAMPGRLLKSILNAKTDNPLILMDEIDKMAHDFRGDPASALLEVLDPEQNNKFRDHYIELSYDLSRVMFITTANSLDTIPRPLLDRMEIIELSAYTELEKLNIAKLHLVPKLLEENAINKKDLNISDSAILEVIRRYTREAGVRQLERKLANIIRRAALNKVKHKQKKVSVSVKNLEEYLGKGEFTYDRVGKENLVGVCTGLAWTAAGGDILSIEVNIMPGSGKVEMTGSLGDVMKESVSVAMGYIRSQSKKLNLDDDFYKQHDIHVHVPEGAIPKDGPSAGITLATAIISALTAKKIKHNLAMTGELTLRGRVLAIGGLKEKLIAALRSGITEVVIPFENSSKLDELPEVIKEKLTIHTVKSLDEVLAKAFV